MRRRGGRQKLPTGSKLAARMTHEVRNRFKREQAWQARLGQAARQGTNDIRRSVLLDHTCMNAPVVAISRVLVKPVQQRSPSRLMEATITPEGDGLVQLELTTTLCCRPLQPLQGLDLSLAELVVPLPDLFIGKAATAVLLTSAFLMNANRKLGVQASKTSRPFHS